MRKSHGVAETFVENAWILYHAGEKVQTSAPSNNSLFLY